MIYNILAFLCGTAIAGGGVYMYLSTYFSKKESDNVAEAEKKAADILRSADTRAKDIVTKAQEDRQDIEKKYEETKREMADRKKEVLESEERVNGKELRIEKKLEELEVKSEGIRTMQDTLETKIQKVDEEKNKISSELSKVARMSEVDAKEMLIKATEERYEKDILGLMEKKRKDLKLREQEVAKEIIIKSIQQYASEVCGETSQTMVQLESDDLKGKIIGKEGRNIVAFEKMTGVSIIIDDTPDTVFLSSFDLFRRYIAKKSLEDLIADKRIQPARIEEIVEKNQQDAEKLIFELGAKTIDEMGITGVPEEILPLIGKFRFRTSYGQNILMHSKEVAYIAESIAKLIGADPILALKGGLLHDLGKAMDHDVEGTHPEIGGRIARKYGLDEKIVNIIEGHHDDVPQICIETKIVQIADAISAVRPGARRMNADDFVKRVGEMENIAMSFSGVAKAYALSAGREVRVFVDATTISDLQAAKLAQDIATNIETNCNYPGEVKINLIRESRVVEYAK